MQHCFSLTHMSFERWLFCSLVFLCIFLFLCLDNDICLKGHLLKAEYKGRVKRLIRPSVGCEELTTHETHIWKPKVFFSLRDFTVKTLVCVFIVPYCSYTKLQLRQRWLASYNSSLQNLSPMTLANSVIGRLVYARFYVI